MSKSKKVTKEIRKIKKEKERLREIYNKQFEDRLKKVK